VGPGVAAADGCQAWRINGVEEAEERIMAKQHALAGGVRYGPALSLQLGVSRNERDGGGLSLGV
jgi:hypothetical protein